MIKFKRIDSVTIVALLILCMTTLLFFGHILFSHNMFAFRDFHRYFYPIRNWVQEMIKGGTVPFWNPYLYSGLPLLATLQHGLFYPPSILTYLFPFNPGIKLYCIIHYFLATINMYFLARGLKMGHQGAIIAACVYGFSGYMLSVLDLLTTLSAACWIPLAFLFVNNALLILFNPEQKQTRLFWYIIGTAIVFGLEFLGGEPFVLYSTLMGLICFIVVRLINYMTGHRPIQWTIILKGLGLLPLISIIAMGLVAPQMIPFIEFIPYSSRAEGIKYTREVAWSLAPYEILGLFIPFFSGNIAGTPSFYIGQIWLKSIYVGIFTTLCAMWAVISIRTRLIRLFTAMALIFIILSFGDYLRWIYKIIYTYMPGLSMMRYSVKFMGITTFALSILAGFGFERILSDIKDGRKNVLWFFGGCFVILIIMWILCWYNQFSWPYLIRQILPPEISITMKQLIYWYSTLLINLFLLIIIVGGGICIIFLGIKGWIKSFIVSFSLAGIIIIDLYLFSTELIPVVKEQFYKDTPLSLKEVSRNDGIYRIMLEPKTEKSFRTIKGNSYVEAIQTAQKFLVPDFGLLYQLFDAKGYESIQLKDYMEFIRIIDEKKLPYFRDLLNIRYFISNNPLNSADFKLVYSCQDVLIYENKGYFPRAFFVPKARIIKGKKEQLRYMCSRAFNPLKEVILSEEIIQGAEGRGQGVGITQKKVILQKKITTSAVRSSASYIQSKVTNINYGPNVVSFDIAVAQDGFIVLADTYYPGWTVFVDGNKQKVYRADFILRATCVKKGVHKLNFVYDPVSFKWGLLVSIVTILGCMGGYVWLLCRGNPL